MSAVVMHLEEHEANVSKAACSSRELTGVHLQTVWQLCNDVRLGVDDCRGRLTPDKGLFAQLLSVMACIERQQGGDVNQPQKQHPQASRCPH